MPKVSDVTMVCSVCRETYSETFFRTYKYKGETRRLKNCKFCVVKRKDFKDMVRDWIDNQRQGISEEQLKNRYEGFWEFE